MSEPNDAEETTKAPAEEEEEENAPAKEEESTAVFEPVVKLDVVETNTGEEDEEVLYSQRAKVYVFAETLLDVGTGNKVWKERGVGNLRVLRHKEHSRIRILMRQEKTHKIIMNHTILPGHVLVPHATSDKAIVWRAEDYSDMENLVVTDFCVRFANSEIATDFKDKFAEFQEAVKALYEGDDAAEQAEADDAAEALSGLKVASGNGEAAEGEKAAEASAE